MENKKIKVKDLRELRKIIKDGEIPLQNIDIKGSNLISFVSHLDNGELDVPGLFNGIDFKNINGTIKDWDVSGINNFSFTFHSAKNIPFDEISNWNVSSAFIFNHMFGFIKDLNVDLSKWNLKNATMMSGMFTGSSFSGKIFDFNKPKKIYNASNIFYGAEIKGEENINKILSWNISLIDYQTGLFKHSNLKNEIIKKGLKWNLEEVENKFLEIKGVKEPRYTEEILF